KFLNVTVSAAADDMVKLPGLLDLPEVGLWDLYRESALGFGGLAVTETRTGNIKFVQVAAPTKGRAISNFAYFTPNEETEALLESLKGNGKEAEAFLRNYIERTNQANNGQWKNFNWEIKYTKVKTLPDGALATVVPELGQNKLVINLKITPEGLKNPAVMLEEYVHLSQITDGAHFKHPYEWAETVANARAGSPRA